jgi:hypothetical protein
MLHCVYSTTLDLEILNTNYHSLAHPAFRNSLANALLDPHSPTLNAMTQPSGRVCGMPSHYGT